MYYTSIWFRHPDYNQDCVLISGIPDWIADRLINALSVEFPEHTWWAE